MDALLSGIGLLFVLTVVILSLAYSFKYRRRISRWLDYPYFAEEDRKLNLKRTIEDAQKELEWVEQHRQTETEE